ncbi:MAG: DUF58 domain-containing protein [Ruminococcus sp.]|nr:DUF58 domain-containing protein [Ruminococcus sp.]
MIKKLKTLVSVGAVAFLLYIFTFYIDGEMGIILLAFLIFAPLISLIITLYARKRIIVTISCDAFVKKSSRLTVTVKVEKKGVFPLSIVEIHPSASEVFEKIVKVYRLSMFRGRISEFTFDIAARAGGNGEVSIASVYSCDFLGFMKFRIREKLPEPVSIGVVPEIPEVKASSQLFKTIADVVMTDDNNEESDTAMIFSTNTTPGYEHREYVQGDPLKRVNWKLSSKKSKLMVRLDEAAATVQPMIVLDLFRSGDANAEISVFEEEKLLSSVFALLTLLIKQGIACNFVYYGESGEVISETVDNPDYPAQLLLKVLAVKVESNRRIDVSGLEGSVCACVIATTDAGNDFKTVTDNMPDSQNVSLLGVTADTVNKTGLPLWYLDEGNNYKMV